MPARSTCKICRSRPTPTARYLRSSVTLDELVVSSVQTGGSGGEDRMMVNIALNFAKIKFDVWSFNPQGVRNTTPASYGWSVIDNRAY